MKTALLAAAAVMVSASGCTPPLYDPSRATRPYPDELHLVTTVNEEGEEIRAPRLVDMQVFRDQQHIIISNSTARGYRDFDLWLNKRFVRHVDDLPAGARLRLSLWDFVDERGDVFNAGGLFRTTEPLPVRLVQIEPGEGEKLIGLVAIPGEDED